MAKDDRVISAALLFSEQAGLGVRLRNRLVVKKPTKTLAEDLLRELRAYKWIGSTPSDSRNYALTDDGKTMADLCRKNPPKFRQRLLAKMHERFTIPGWFVSRLYALNPSGAGEIVLPAPLRDWRPGPRRWEDSDWNEELSQEAGRTYDHVRAVLPTAFPVQKGLWIEAVKDAWNVIASARRRRVSQPAAAGNGKKPPVKTYTPRGRLSRAMRCASIQELFGNSLPESQRRDFPGNENPIPPRSFQSWCPLLESLELIFYTDSHPDIMGRLIFPCCVFRSRRASRDFEPVHAIKDPLGRVLYIYQPRWTGANRQFISTLRDVYLGMKRRFSTIYVPLLDVRDEVCRQLRLNARLFDEFLEHAIRITLDMHVSKVHLPISSISVESDVRPDQRSGSGLLRRPVYLHGVPHSLIAMTVSD